MSYSGYGGFVYLNGIRQHSHEDGEFNEHLWHVRMGNGEVCIAGYKSLPYLFVNGDERQTHHSPYELTTETRFAEEDAWYGKIRGHYFGAVRYHLSERPQVMEMFLLEPSGAIWNSTMGISIGAGWEDEFNAREEVVRPKSAEDIYKYIQDRYRLKHPSIPTNKFHSVSRD